VAECEAAAAVIGPLGLAGPMDLPALRDPLLRRRARHVVSECSRVDEFADALARDDLAVAGACMDASHTSLATDFEASTPEVDALVADLRARPGVVGVRMTGAGWGGCVVALGAPGALDPAALGLAAWQVTPVDGTVARRTG
jgi:galactokinase